MQLPEVKFNIAKLIVFHLSLCPLAYLIFQAFRLDLGPDPQLKVIHETGLWAMYFLFFTLLLTPAYRWFNWRWAPHFSRMLGLFSLFYASLHILAYTFFILGLDLSLLIEETIKRPYIAVGAVAFITLSLLGATSTKGMMRRLGKKWKKLHRSIYWITPLVVWHYHWSLKLGKEEVYPFIVGIVVLLVLRLPLLKPFQKKFKQKFGQITK